MKQLEFDIVTSIQGTESISDFTPLHIQQDQLLPFLITIIEFQTKKRIKEIEWKC